MKKLFCLLCLMISFGFVFSQDAQSMYSSGKAKFQSQDFKGAIADFTKAIELNSKDLNYYLQRAMAYGLDGDYEAAIKDYTVVVSAEPKHTLAYVSRGGAYNKTKKYEKAIIDFNKAIEIDPENTEAYNNRGFAKNFLGDKKGACKDWKESKKKGNDEAKIILKNNKC